MRQLCAIGRNLTGNLPPMPGVFPDYLAPIVRMVEGERQLEVMRWGMQGPPQFGGAPITNIRNAKSPHWRRQQRLPVALRRQHSRQSWRTCWRGAARIGTGCPRP